MRNRKISEYTRTIGIKPNRMATLDRLRGKKSKAGKLDEIIEFYLINSESN